LPVPETEHKFIGRTVRRTITMLTEQTRLPFKQLMHVLTTPF